MLSLVSQVPLFLRNRAAAREHVQTSAYDLCEYERVRSDGAVTPLSNFSELMLLTDVRARTVQYSTSSQYSAVLVQALT